MFVYGLVQSPTRGGSVGFKGEMDRLLETSRQMVGQYLEGEAGFWMLFCEWVDASKKKMTEEKYTTLQQTTLPPLIMEVKNWVPPTVVALRREPFPLP